MGILEINAYLDELSTYMGGRIEATLAEYGICLVNFFVNDISVPEDDPAVKKLKDALAKKAEMDIIGYNYHQERSFNTLEGAAKNPGSAAANMMGAGIGMGVGVPLGHVIGQEMQHIGRVFSTAGPQEMVTCRRCQAQVPLGKRFCPDCGNDLESTKQQQLINCSKCGAVLTPTVKFCPECGDKYNPCPNCAMDLPLGAKVCKACGYAQPQPCPGCGKPVAEGAKFCPECGISLVRSCAGCGAEISGTPKFCPSCGRKLAD